ncbi:MAG: murein L,D-transpeptidase [Sphingobacteriales bacterium]|jgi:murein L,D-transpeptidase YcbB/YkuD
MNTCLPKVSRFGFLVFLSAVLLLGSCDQKPSKPKAEKKVIVQEPERLEPSVVEQIGVLVNNAADNEGLMDDSIRIHNPAPVAAFFKAKSNQRIWSKDKQWLPVADSMLAMISNAEYYGLFPEDYHQPYLANVFSLMRDSIKQRDAALWARGEVLLSDAVVTMARHLKWGRLGRDSSTLRKDSVFAQSFYDGILTEMFQSGSPRSVLEKLEPSHQGYQALKAAIPLFLDSMDRTRYTYVEHPFKDSLAYVKQLQARLFEESYITFNTRMPDTIELAAAVKRAQVARGLKVDGKAGPQLIGSLNNTGLEKFKRIAINLDRFKTQLPDSMPTNYIFVNLPSFKLQVVDSGEVVLESKVIVGQPRTRTPVLNSAVVNFITFPQWTVPYSIIFKEMLPKIQKDIKYLDKEKLMVVDKYDSVIDPATVDWKQLSKTNFPYLLRQRQGDDNSLGVIKFNFSNKFDVYMHDTNARGMFSRSSRALSHGCVRVQSWDTLARFLLARDTANVKVDTVKAWMARQEKHMVPLKKRVPVYLRYFTCEVGEDGRIRFFEDIYGDDKLLRMKYLAKK